MNLSPRARRIAIALLVVAALCAGGYYTYVRIYRDADHAGSQDEIRLFASGGFDIGTDRWSEFRRLYGLSVNFKDSQNDIGPVLAQLCTSGAADDYDVAGVQGGAESELIACRAIEPWDVSQIPNYAEMWAWIKSIPHLTSGGRVYGIPIGVNADSMIYLPDRLKDVPGYETGEVKSYGAVFDERLRGKTSMEDSWMNSVIFTAMYLKHSGRVKIEEPGDLTEAELREVMQFLMEKKRAGQFRKLWSGWEQGVDLIRSGEVLVMTGWEPIQKQLVRDGVNAKYAEPVEGYEGWTQDLVLLRGAAGRDRKARAHQFCNALLDGYFGATLAELRGYIVPNDRGAVYSKAHPEANIGSAVGVSENVRRKLATKVYWQNVRPRNYRLYEQLWNQFRGM